MPFLGVDPWRWQYFTPIRCPPGVSIPIDEASAWALYPELRWIHNKLEIAASQGLPHGPHGVMPRRFPVFSKPIFNMRGMGTGGRIVRSKRDYLLSLQPGHMWMRLLKGVHVSTDVVLARGRPKWWRHVTGKPSGEGTFDLWTIHAARRPALERYLTRWMRRKLPRFSGIVNFETIGGRIIECHLRMADQWPDLYGPGWREAAVALYGSGRWRWRERGRRIAYSVVLFGRHGRRWTIDPGAVDRLRSLPGVSSIQITFDEAKPPAAHAMPPGGFRLAIVNCWDLKLGKRVRARLKRAFVSRPS
ncbi:MAG: hypothetical protein ACREIP_07395 [Alphaproteobacteria bacterium]